MSDDAIVCVGIDPGGFRNIGIVSVKVPRDATLPVQILECLHLGTEPTKRKKTVRASSDMMDRGRIIGRSILRVVRESSPRAIFTEGYSATRSNAASSQQGWMFGEITMVALVHGIPLYEIPPREVKRVLAASGKAAVEAIVQETCVFSDGAREMMDRIRPSDRNHVYDAIGVILAARDSNEMLTLFGAV